MDLFSDLINYANSVSQSPLVRDDMERRKLDHIKKVFAANPQYASSLYNTLTPYTNPQSGQDLPAAVKIANELQSARASGDTQRVQDLIALTKTLDRGLTLDASGNPVALPGYADALGQIGYGQRLGQTQGVKDVERVMNPLIAQDTEQAKFRGQNLGAKEADYEKVIDSSTYLLDKIDELAGNAERKIPAHAGLPGILGVQKKLPDYPGSEASGARARLEEIGGAQFLQAYESLAGSGAVSNAEGKEAKNAISRMLNAPNEKEFQAAANDFRGTIKKGMNRAAKGIAVKDPYIPEQPPTTGADPLAGILKGGQPRTTPPALNATNPNDMSGWSIKKK